MKKRIISKFILVIAILLFTTYYLYSFYKIKYDNKLVENYFITKANVKNKDTNENIKQTDNYLGILEIPKLEIKKGFYDISNKLNKVNKNIQVLKGSTMPDQENNILVIASHSGNGINAYFKNLHKLAINDDINIYYQNNLYEYEVKEIYNVFKTGQINIPKQNEKTLVLTTCKNKKQQLIVIAHLKKL